MLTGWQYNCYSMAMKAPKPTTENNSPGFPITSNRSALKKASLKVNSPAELALRGKPCLPLSQICTCRRQPSPFGWPLCWLAASRIFSALLRQKPSLKAPSSAGSLKLRCRLHPFASKFRRLESGQSCGLSPAWENKLSFTVPADGYISDTYGQTSGATVRVKLSRDREAIEQEISVAGCDPAIFLAGEHLRRQKDQTSFVGWPMGSMAALRALQRGEVHVAGLHLFDPIIGESNMPFLRRH